MQIKLDQLQKQLKKKIGSVTSDTAKQDFNFVSLINNTLPELSAFQVSNKMARLLRFRLLSMVNANKVINNQEVPYTKYDKVQKLLKDNNLNITTEIIDGLQAQEAQRAIRFVNKQLDTFIPSSRKKILRAALKTVREKIKNRQGRTPIPMISLLYNMEVCMKSIGEGIVLVKNKTKLVDKPIPNAQPCQVYIKMPQERILTPLEVQNISDDTPLFVIEGYSRTNDLARKIQKIGLMNLLRINSSDPRIQFLGCDNTPLEEPLEEERALLDMQREEITQTVFELDHVFCSSMKQEKDEFLASFEFAKDVLAQRVVGE